MWYLGIRAHDLPVITHHQQNIFLISYWLMAFNHGYIFAHCFQLPGILLNIGIGAACRKKDFCYVDVLKLRVYNIIINSQLLEHIYVAEIMIACKKFFVYTNAYMRFCLCLFHRKWFGKWFMIFVIRHQGKTMVHLYNYITAHYQAMRDIKYTYKAACSIV